MREGGLRVRILPELPKLVPNEAPSPGDVIRLPNVGPKVVITAAAWVDPSWAVSYRKLTNQSQRIVSELNPGLTFLTTDEFFKLPRLGRWSGALVPGSSGIVGNIEQPVQGKEGQMATKVKSNKTKPAAASKTNGGEKARRTKEDVDALVPAFVAHLTNGGKMKDLKTEYGFSDDGAIRSALYRNGYDAKGEEHEVEEKSIDASKAAGKKSVVKLRGEGTAWYALAYMTGLTEPEVKRLVADSGGDAAGRAYNKTEQPAKAKAKVKPAVSKVKKAKAKAADPS